MRYIDYVELDYVPGDGDLVCDFYVEPKGISLEEAAGGVAAESSIGTWTELMTAEGYVEELRARVYSIEGNRVKIAYPSALFEPGNIPNILSSVAGNVFGLGALANLRLEDVSFPRDILGAYKGPKYGIGGVRRILRVRDRPLVGTIVKPKLGLETGDHAKVAYEAWLGGCDIVKDDENLGSQSFNPFYKRLKETLKARDRAEKETGERKAYLVNITAPWGEMIKRAKAVVVEGGEYAMVDILTCGFSSVQGLRDEDLDLIYHAHRAGHAAFTKNPKHGISMRVVSKIIRMIGLDQLHVGTAVGKMSETREEVLQNCDVLRGEMGGLKGVLPVASGGLHPGLVPQLMDIFGMDFVIQAGGGIHGNPRGTVAGAKAMRQAVDAVLRGETLEDCAGRHEELASALRTWA
ncbi:MAG: type III ribulose-bisphosphate carboxylase [Candidatus Hydrothermarchaeaceae archaeon]